MKKMVIVVAILWAALVVAFVITTRIREHQRTERFDRAAQRLSQEMKELGRNSGYIVIPLHAQDADTVNSHIPEADIGAEIMAVNNRAEGK